MRWGAIALGAAGLAVLEAVISSAKATSNVGGAVVGFSTLVEKFLSPKVPAFGSKTSTTADVQFQQASSTTPPAAGSIGAAPNQPGAAASPYALYPGAPSSVTTPQPSGSSLA